MNNPTAAKDDHLKMYWFGAMIALFSYFWFRNAGLNPVVMADEWYYSSFSRLTAPADIPIPSYLYTWIYSATTSCGTGYLDCARLLNALFFLAAAPFIYLTGRRFLSPRIASLVALLAMVGPVNSYTAYFMPESLYFCAFWIATLSAFRFADAPRYRHAVVLGVVVGALLLIKVHALFLIPSIAAFTFYSAMRGSPKPFMAALRNAAVLTVLMLLTGALVRVGFGYLVAGRSSLSLFGALYQAQANGSAAQHIPLTRLLHLALSNLRGHASALTMLFGVPIAALLSHVFDRRDAGDTVSRSPLAVYTALMMLALLALTVGFTASVAGSGQESNARLHMRYYNFALPLLIMFAATQIGRASKLAKPFAILIAAAVAGIMVLTIATLWKPYTPSMVDSPEFQGMTLQLTTFYWLAGLSMLSVLGWAFDRELGARIFLFGFMPLFALFATYGIHQEVRNGGATNDFDRAGAFAREYLTDDQRGRLGIVGSDASGIFRAHFHVDKTNVWQHMSPQNAPIDLKDMPPEKAWLLVLGNYPTPEGAAVRLQAPGFALMELGANRPVDNTIQFFRADDPLLAKVDGLSGVEPWGRWSLGKTVIFQLSRPLPRKFSMVLIAEPYGPNAGKDVTVTVGKAQQTIRLEKKGPVAMTFESNGTDRTISFEVPEPTSPNSLNGSGDMRLLGIGFTSLEIHPVTP